jgi:hypothetical protein
MPTRKGGHGVMVRHLAAKSSEAVMEPRGEPTPPTEERA